MLCNCPRRKGRTVFSHPAQSPRKYGGPTQYPVEEETDKRDRERERELARSSSHRRRRLHAAFLDSQDDDEDADHNDAN